MTTTAQVEHYSSSQLCELLNVHRNTITTLIDSGAFPGAFKVGRVWRIPATALDAYIERRKAAAQELIKAHNEKGRS